MPIKKHTGESISSSRSEYVELLKLGLPVMLTQIGVIVMGFADTLMVGAYGVDQLAASAFVNNVYLIPMVMLSGLGSGLTPLVGALLTGGNRYSMGRIVRAGLQINAIVSVLFTIIMGIVYFYLDSFGQPSELMPVIRPYYITLLSTLLPMAVFNTFSQTSNGLTDTRTPMWILLGAILLNIIGNYFLIFGHCGFPRLGLTGAGIATAISRFSAAAGIGFIFLRADRYKSLRKGFFDSLTLGEHRRKVWLTSYPIMIQTGVECSLWTFGAVVCGWFGKIQLAAYQVVNTIGQLGFMLYMSFGIAVSIRVANYCGAENRKGVRTAVKAGLKLNLLLATVASLAMVLFAHQMIGAFSSEQTVVAAGELFVIPLVLYQYLDATQLTYINAIRGTSHVRPLLWISVISYILVGIPILLLFAMGCGWEGVGVYYSFNVALLSAATLAIFFFRKISIRI